MERRRVIQLLAAGATTLWAKQQLPASALLEAAAPVGPRSPGAGSGSHRIIPVAQASPQPELLLPLFPLGLVLLPHVNLPLHIFEERYKEMIQDCLQNYWEFGILLVQDQSVKSIGCTASISEVLERFPDGRMNILVRGRRRFEISSPNQEKSYLRGKVQFFDDDATEPPAEEARQEALRLYGRLRESVELENQSFHEPRPAISDPQLSFRMLAGMPADLGWKQGLLELRSERERLARVVTYFKQLLDHLEHPPEPQLPAGRA